MPAAVQFPPNAASQITICACGTSWHAALVGEYLLETLANIRVEVEYASEFRYRHVHASHASLAWPRARTPFLFCV